MDSETTTLATTQPRDLHDAAFYALVRKVADICLEGTSQDPTGGFDKVWVADRRSESANPFYDQTVDGIFLEMYYGMPSKLWTPWGKYGFAGSGSGRWDALLPKILERLGATVYSEEEVTDMGSFGPVYALHKVDDTPLPEPARRVHADYISYEESKEAWKDCTERYAAT